MRTSSLLAPLFLAATALGQAVEEGIAPDSPTPDGCKTTVSGSFRIGTLENPSLKKRDSASATEAADGELICTLQDGILHDQYNRTGSIVANHQFQFDGPPQAGAIYTGGFSVCSNDSLALGGSTRWWRCMSGAFGNLYDEWIGAQCHEIRIQAVFDDSSSSSSSASSHSATSTASGSASETLSTISIGLTSVANSTASITSDASSGSATATSTSGSDDATASSATGSAGATASSTGSADAPPASGAQSSASLAMFGLPMVILGAALML